jgi:hypothetical protein
LLGGNFCGVTAASLRNALNCAIRKEPIEDSAVNALLRKVKVCGSIIPHTPQRKAVLRQQIFSIITHLGWPTFFLTLSPCDLKSPLVKLLKGQGHTSIESIINSLFGHEQDTENLAWNQFNNGQNGNDPISCSRFFHMTLQAIIKHLLGWDETNSIYTPSIFGHVQGHYAVIEEQQRKTLHVHMLIWVQEFSDYQKFHKDMEDPGYETKFKDYINQLLCERFDQHVELPTIGNTQKTLCPILERDTWREVLHKEHEKVQRVVQVHRCQPHCLKRNGKCRYQFPKAIAPETVYDKITKELKISRNDSNINTNLPCLTAICRSNNDIQFIPGKGDPKIARYIAYYISNYTSKTSSQTIDLLRFMVDKLDTSYNVYRPDLLEPENSKGLFQSLLVKTLNYFVAGTEIGGPEAASLLLGYNDHYTGHLFVPIDWKGWDLWLCKQLTGYTNHQYQRFAHSSTYHNIVTRNQNGATMGERLDLLSATHDRFDDYLHRSDTLKSTCLWDYTSTYRFTSSSDGNNVLPFRESHPLFRPADDNGFQPGVFPFPVKHFPTLPWFNTTSTVHGIGTESFYRIMTLLFVPFRCASDFLNETLPTFKLFFEIYKTGKNFKEAPYSYMYNMEFNALESQEAQVFIPDAGGNNPHVNALLPDQEAAALFEQIDNRWTQVQFHIPEPLQFDLSYISETELTGLMHQIKLANELPVERNEALGALSQLDYFGNTMFLDNDEVNYIAFIKGLETESTCSVQWNAVKVVAQHVWKLFTGVATPPLRALVHGEGGTGKSFIIKCISTIFDYLKRPQWLVKCAYTGKAAIGINGDTIDCLFRISRKEAKGPPTQRAQDAKFFIVDEISMIGKLKLHQMHMKLGHFQNLKEGEHIFGDKSFLFAGDFQQFEPIGDDSLVSKRKVNQANVCGKLVFQSITHYFELIEQKRQTDPEYLALLRRIRNNTPLKSDVNFLKKYCKPPTSLDDLSADWLLKQTIIVSTNENRYNWNSRVAKMYASKHELPIHYLKSIDVIDHPVSAPIMDYLSTSMLKHLQPMLHLCIGMPVVILYNLYKYLGVTNGSSGIIQDIKYGINQRPTALYITMLNCDFQVEGLEPNTVIIKTQEESGTITMRNLNLTMKWKRKQFPISEGFCITDYKSQGSTIENALISLSDSKRVSTYVKLSRTKNRIGTTVMPSFTLDNLKITMPNGYLDWRKILETECVSTAEIASGIIDFN